MSPPETAPGIGGLAAAPMGARESAHSAGATSGTPGLEPPPARRERMLGALNLLPVDRPPVWLMRQAGRCLPEYRALREKHSFLDLIRTPELAAEVTLQPVRRFGFDAAILFSDILVVPEAMGQPFRFGDAGGVEMEKPVRDVSDIRALLETGVSDRLGYVAGALELVKRSLDGRAALLGFAGSPWTLANFMLEGGSAKKFVKARQLFDQDRAAYDLLAGKLAAAVTEFLLMQIACGVDAVQIFDSAGGDLPAADFEAASGRWMEKIVAKLNRRAPVIVYSKGTRAWEALARIGANVIAVDHGIALEEAERRLPRDMGIQGNLDPALLAGAEPATVAAETRRLLELMRGRNGYIFNLGHGVPPDARLENIAALADTVQSFV
jgi:uroporphyrinogen decarboxylase